MRRFATLLDGLGYTQSRNRKIALLGRYFRAAPDPDRGWALAALTDGVPVRVALRRMIADLTGRFIDPVLYKLSRDYVGDTAETVALLWPDRRSNRPAPSLDEVVAEMQIGTLAERTEALGRILDALDPAGRWAVLKLIGGAPRVGVSARLARTALAEAYGRDVGEIEEIWHALTPPYLDLFAWLQGKKEKPDPGETPVFRPVMLAHAIEDEDWRKLAAADFVAEWKWDGVRVQVAAAHGDVRMFSRMGDDISAAFPEIRTAFASGRCVVDGELLIIREWKRAALTLDCVLMYAQRGSGKRSSFYSDYTFGVWRDGESAEAELVPVGKAYSGFTDEELRQIDRWIRAHTVETFGPVRAVSPGLVFEVAFDAVQPSTRHKSGVAMRFPRIHRIRWDKPAADADTLQTVKGLIERG